MFLTFLTELLFDVCLHQKDKFTVRRLTVITKLTMSLLKKDKHFCIHTSFYFIFTHFYVFFFNLSDF